MRELGQPLTVSYALTAPQYAKAAGSLLLLRPHVVGTVAEPFESKPRRLPVDFKAKGTWREKVDIDLPVGFAVDDLPAPTTLDTPFATYRSAFHYDATTSELEYRREYVQKALRLTAEEYPALRRFEQAVLADEGQSAVLKRR